jgi:maltooligosyltrehalose trehalohydrolase
MSLAADSAAGRTNGPGQDKGPSMRRRAIGAEPVDGGTAFRVWAPDRSRVEVVLYGSEGEESAIALSNEGAGYFSGTIGAAAAGVAYRYRLDGTGDFPDPASRYQPAGPHGPSVVIDSNSYRWESNGWKGLRGEREVVYEMHVGTFTAEGTWNAASARLGLLADLGITVIEVMPVAEFPGNFGWGYDGVDLFAPTRLYGTPDEFRAFVDTAHQLGLGVILDVVYNHLGPDGNYLSQFAKSYFTDRYPNEWGEPINFDGENSAPVREFFRENAAYWIDEFRLDGLRLDATQNIFDSSEPHVIEEIVTHARNAAGSRPVWIVAENEPQDRRMLQFGCDAIWNDDFHHTARVAMTGRREAYYTDYRGTPQELISAAKWNFLFQGQQYVWQKKRRGSPTFGIPPWRFVTFLQNHDQVANTLHGRRVHQLTSAGRVRAMTAFMLLIPAAPMLFQGQEFAASAPFLYFADHEPELAARVAKGRSEFLEQFPSIASPEIAGALPLPHDPRTFRQCRLDWSERDRNREWLALHRDLIRLQRTDPAIRQTAADRLDGAVLASEALVLRFFGEETDDRLLIVNLGQQVNLEPAPEPLLAPPRGQRWETLWSSEALQYGGSGAAAAEHDDGRWLIPAQAALVLRPVPDETKRSSESFERRRRRA